MFVWLQLIPSGFLFSFNKISTSKRQIVSVGICRQYNNNIVRDNIRYSKGDNVIVFIQLQAIDRSVV